MLTREEELQNLRKMKEKISSINSMQNKIDEMNDRIVEESNRPMKEAPEYTPSNYYKMAKKTVEDRRANTILKMGIFFCIILCAYAVISLIYLVKVNALGLVGVILYLLSYIFVLGLLGFYADGEADFGKLILALVLNFILHLILGSIGLFYGNVYFISAGMSISFAVIIAVAYLISTITLKHYLVEGKQRDEEHKRQYEIDLQINESKLIEENKRIELDKKHNIEKYNNSINEYKIKISHEIALLNTIPGLAVQDKNEYTVNTLITYFERGKADSIKEAINLFDVEERDRQDRERQSAWNRIMLEEQMRAERERKELIEKQEEENRRRYNELRRLENERNEKVDEFIKEVKSKLDE